MSEDTLIRQLQQQKPDAFRLLVDRYGDLVYNTALGLLQHREEARDVAQEVFAKVFLSISGFRGDARLSTWLYRITVTQALAVMRARKRQKRFALVQPLFGSDNLQPVADPGHFQHPGVLLEHREKAAVLFQAIGQLPENQKTAFVLHKMEDLSYAEIAEAMQCSLSAVESLLFRAKQNLRRLLAGYYEAHEK